MVRSPRRAGAIEDRCSSTTCAGAVKACGDGAAVAARRRGLSPQDGRDAHSRRSCARRCCRWWRQIERADRARSRRAGREVEALCEAPPRDRGAAPGHRRGADHRAHVRADDREPGALPAEPCRWGPTSGSCRGSRDSGERAAATAASAKERRRRRYAGCWCRLRTTSSVPFGPDTDLRQLGCCATRESGARQREEARGRGCRDDGCRCCCSRCGRAGSSTNRCATRTRPARPRNGRRRREAARAEIRKRRPER